MKFIKELFNYYKATVFAPRGKIRQYAPIVAGYFLLILGLQLSGLYNFNNGAAVSCAGTAGVLFLSGAAAGICTNSKPNLIALMPISRKKSLVFRFITVFLIWLTAMAVIFAAMLFVGLLTAVIVSIVEGGESVLDYPMGVYGGLFTAFYFVMLYSASMLSGLIKSRKVCNIFLLCFVILLFGGILLMGIPCKLQTGSLAAPFVSACYESMSMPWLFITLWGVAAFALFGVALYLGIKQYSAKY